MRPHVEIIAEDDYVWHTSTLPGSTGEARERRLSTDEEDGSSSLRIDFDSDWSRAAGVPAADTEFFVLEGTMNYDGTEYGKHAYLHVPKGIAMGALSFPRGTKVLHYREYGHSDFEVGGSSRAGATGEVTILDTTAMEYIAVDKEGPMPGLFIKLLHRDSETGFYTRLIYAKEGWLDHRLAHHPCYEEAYTIAGNMTYNFGLVDTGAYFFRPALVKHGHFIAHEGGTEWLIRSDGELVNWYTTNEWIKWGGESENYGKTGTWETTHNHATGEERAHEHYNHAFPSVGGNEQDPIPSTMPVRSRSRGRWNGDGM